MPVFVSFIHVYIISCILNVYSQVVSWISVRSLLAIASIHELSSRLIDFLLDFLQDDLDVDIFIELYFGMLVDQNRVELVLNVNESLSSKCELV